MGFATVYLDEPQAANATRNFGPPIARCGQAGVTRDFALFHVNKIDPKSVEDFGMPILMCGDVKAIADFAVYTKAAQQAGKKTTVSNKNTHSTQHKL
jgi:hypothetical protein